MRSSVLRHWFAIWIGSGLYILLGHNYPPHSGDLRNTLGAERLLTNFREVPDDVRGVDMVHELLMGGCCVPRF